MTSRPVSTLHSKTSSSFARARVASVACAAVVMLTGCRVVTPEELANFENHAYPDRSQAQVFAAAVTGLKSIGYEVVLADKAAFRIKTAPKTVAVQAVAGSNMAVAVSDTIAWTVDVLTTPGGASMHAEPRFYRAAHISTFPGIARTARTAIIAIYLRSHLS